MQPDVPELETIRDAIRWGASQFRAAGLHFGHGTDNAFDESAWLVLHGLDLPLDTPEVWWSARLTKEERQRLLARLRERVLTRKPAAYLTGEAWFMGLPFQVDRRVLVPRSPLAEVIAEGFAPWLDPTGIHRVLDLGTGSGCLGLAVAAVLPDAEVWLTDVSEDALAVARINIERHGRSASVHCLRSDVFDALPPDLRFDVIVSNPPYVDAADLAAMPAEFHQEPRLGLAAGTDGLDVVRRILQGAHAHLQPEGILMVEVGNSQAALEAAFPELPFTWLEFAHGGLGVFLLHAADLPTLDGIPGYNNPPCVKYSASS